MALTKTQVSMLYVAIFNRASEGEGNKYWQTNQPDMASTANAMLNTPDAKAYFGSSLDTDQAFIELIYKNTLNKTYSDDKDGIDYWVKELANKSRGEVVAALVNAVADYKDSTDATTKAAYDQFMNRVEVSDYVADKMEKAPDDYKTSLGFDGDLTVTNDASTVTTAESIIDDAVQSANAQKLTVQPDDIHGTSGDDLFDGSVVQNSINGNNQNTFTNEDRIDGGTGEDTLIIQNTGVNISGAVSNVENIEFTAFGEVTYDMSNTTGVTDFLNQNSVAKLTVTGANEMNIGIKNVNGKETNIEFDGSVYATTTDSTTLTLENATNQAQVTLKGTNDIETLNIVSKTANNKIDLGGTALANTTKLVITGDKDLSIDDTNGTTAMAKITTVDASAFTGALDLDLRSSGASDEKVNITGGTGDDKVVLTNFTKDDVVDLGAGKDLLSIDLNADVNTAASLKNIEQMSFRTDAAADNNIRVNLANTTELEEIYIENSQNAGGVAETVTATSVVSSIKSVNFVNHDNTTTTNFDNLTLILADSSATDNSLDINVGSVQSPGNPIPVNMKDNEILTLANLTANGIENMTINTANLSKDNDADADTNDSGLSITTLKDEDLVNLTINGDAHVEIVDALANTVKTVDASATTAGVNLNLSAIADFATTSTASTTVTTGSGADTLAVNGEVSNTIKTNAGNDKITLDTADHTLGDKAKINIDAGEGNDTINVSAITALKTKDNDGSIKITTGDGMDTITIRDDYNVTITDFTAGSAGDKINLLANNANDGGTILQTYQEIDTSTTAVGDDTGLVVVTNIVSDADNNGIKLNEILGNGAGTGFAAAEDILYVAYSDGANTYIAKATEVGGDGVDSGDTLVTIATLTGISDASTLNVDNFTDFLA